MGCLQLLALASSAVSPTWRRGDGDSFAARGGVATGGVPPLAAGCCRPGEEATGGGARGLSGSAGEAVLGDGTRPTAEPVGLPVARGVTSVVLSLLLKAEGGGLTGAVGWSP